MLVERTYDPKGYSTSITVNVTEEQANALDKLAEKSEFSALFWASKVEWLNNDDLTEDGNRVVRINGKHMVFDKEHDTDGFRGFGGRMFIVKFTNGKHKGQVVNSTNTWYQGEIPEELRSILVDNAIQY